ncbi:hypothetical protein [Prevotella communis]|nr:hypothetical protein [Prevotella communis]
MVQNAGILMRIAHLEKHQIETDQKMDMLLDRMDKQSPKLLPEQIFATECVWDAGGNGDQSHVPPIKAELRGALLEAKESIEGKRKLNTLDNLINEFRAYVNTTQEHVSDNRHSY